MGAKKSNDDDDYEDCVFMADDGSGFWVDHDKRESESPDLPEFGKLVWAYVSTCKVDKRGKSCRYGNDDPRTHKVGHWITVRDAAKIEAHNTNMTPAAFSLEEIELAKKLIAG